MKDVINLGALQAGKHTVALQSEEAKSGAYSFKVSALGATGGDLTIKHSVVGLVSGFIPGPEPKLVVGGSTVNPAEVTEVNVVKPQEGVK